jgi:hypothetical protein
MKDSRVIETILNGQKHMIDNKEVECKVAIPKVRMETDNNMNNIAFKNKIFIGGLSSTMTESKVFKLTKVIFMIAFPNTGK